jgi:PIN domain nuclease of toxin-antitoxin system
VESGLRLLLDTSARLAGEMNIGHKDPFDRLLIAQAQAEGMAMVSNEAMFDSFAVQRFWKGGARRSMDR